MALKNGPDSFGLVSRGLHWGMMLLVISMLALGLRISDMEPGLANLWLYGLHKTLGVTVLALMLARLGWHLFTPPPGPDALAGARGPLGVLWSFGRDPPDWLGRKFGHRD